MAEPSAFVLFGTPDLEWSRSLRERLRKQGIGVLASTSSQELLELARRCSPAVVVLDDGLESVDGQVLIRLLRGVCPKVRIILLLAQGSNPDREAHQHLEPICTLVSPVSEQDLGAVIASALQDPGPVPTHSVPPVIFCVDDDVLFLKSLVRVLRRRGYSVIGYNDREKALEGIPIHKPQLVFIDVLMPGMNGLDLASEVREEYGDSLPFVLLTAKSSDDEISQGYKSGARYYITKPCEPARVLNIADYLIGGLGPAEREVIGSRL